MQTQNTLFMNHCWAEWYLEQSYSLQQNLQQWCWHFLCQTLDVAPSPSQATEGSPTWSSPLNDLWGTEACHSHQKSGWDRNKTILCWPNGHVKSKGYNIFSCFNQSDFSNVRYFKAIGCLSSPGLPFVSGYRGMKASLGLTYQPTVPRFEATKQDRRHFCCHKRGWPGSQFPSSPWVRAAHN